jgi:TolB-like protein
MPEPEEPNEVGDPPAPGPDPAISDGKAFISYASQDTAIANDLCETLERAELPCWLAPRDVRPGDFYADAIVQAITSCRALILVLSQSAIDSPHVLREVERASSKRRPIITFRIDTAVLPPSLEYFLSASQWLDASVGRADAQFPKLIEAVRSRADSAPSTESSLSRGVGIQPKHTRITALWVLAAIIATALAYFAADKLWLSRRSESEHKAAATAAATAATQSTSTAVFAPPPHSVAVLPFIDMSEKKDQEYFADGMAEELLDLLAKTPGFHVPGRTSSFYFKGKQVPLPDIARALNVGQVLEGSVRRSGNRIRVTAQLIRADTGYHVWSDTYDRNVGDLFKVQDEICAEVAKALRVTLDSEPQQAARTDNPDAYTLYLQARSVFQLGTKAGYETALDYLQRAIQLDPAFAAAWADIVKVYVRQWDAGFLSLPEAAGKARKAAQRALELDPRLAAAHLSMGRVHHMFDWNWLAAETDARQAIELDPGNADAYRWASYAAGTLGRFDVALAFAMQAAQKDPLEPLNYEQIARLYYRTARYPESEVAWRKAHELNPGMFSEDYVPDLLIARGDWAAALARVGQTPGPHNYVPALAYYALGRRSESDQSLSNLIDLHAEDDAFSIAQVYSFRGENDRAFEWLDRAYLHHEKALLDIKGDPLLKNLTGDPRYKAFLRRMNLPE